MNVAIVDDTQINVTLMQALVNRIEGLGICLGRKRYAFRSDLR
jgi:hypothetical protein